MQYYISHTEPVNKYLQLKSSHSDLDKLRIEILCFNNNSECAKFLICKFLLGPNNVSIVCYRVHSFLHAVGIHKGIRKLRVCYRFIFRPRSKLIKLCLRYASYCLLIWVESVISFVEKFKLRTSYYTTENNH